LAVTKTAKWKRDGQPKAKKSGPPTFTGSDPLKLTIEMFLDATDTMNASVVKRVEELFTCCVPTPETVDTKTPSTPWVVLHWGDLRGFAAVVTNVSAKYTLFTAGGTPIRAVCAVTLEEMPTDVARQNPTSGSLVVRDVHQVVAGDTLESLAYRTYGDPALWREIAHANNIDDPMRLRPGRTLLLPAPEELEPGRNHGE
jgi:nucleoid-associated protein YgaU